MHGVMVCKKTALVVEASRAPSDGALESWFHAHHRIEHGTELSAKQLHDGRVRTLPATVVGRLEKLGGSDVILLFSSVARILHEAPSVPLPQVCDMAGERMCMGVFGAN